MKKTKESPDAKLPRKLLSVVLVVGLLLIFFAVNRHTNLSVAINTATPSTSATPSPWITYTSSPYTIFTSTPWATFYVTFTAAPGATRAPGGIAVTRTTPLPPTPILITGKQPPACTFPLPQTTMTESTSESYTFSEPKVVLPNRRGEWPIQIIQWLPDSQRVLLVQDFDGTGNENIEIFNPEGDDLRVYATRDVRREPPAWLPSLNALIYSKEKDVEFTGNQYRRQLWVTRGNSNSARLLEDKTVVDMRDTYSIVVKPDGSEFAYRVPDGAQIFRRDASLKPLPPVNFDPVQWDYRGEIERYPAWPPIYVMSWRPNSSQIFIFSYAGISWDNVGYTFLLDLDTGKVCELDFGGESTTSGLWSPNGRYLATDSAVLDVATGKLYSASGFAWAPDNRHLLSIGDCPTPGCQSGFRMSLIDFLSGEEDPVLPTDLFAWDWYGMLNPAILAWSPDGSKVLALCEDGPDLCLISVQRTGQ